MRGLSDEGYEAFSRICAPLIHSALMSGCYSPSFSLPPSLAVHTQYSGWGEKQVGLLDSVLHSGGS